MQLEIGKKVPPPLESRVWRFSVMGPPVAKGRPRADWRNRRIYTPQKTANYERTVHEIAFLRRPPGWPLDGIYRLEVQAYCRNLNELVDADNMKTIGDALQGVAFQNDKQVRKYSCETHVIGGPSRTVEGVDEPRVDILIEVLEG